MESLNENWELFCTKLEKVKQTSNGIEAFALPMMTYSQA